jgi:hypothetical protein
MVSHIREEHRLRVFEDIVLRRISAPMREDGPGGWRKLRYDDLHKLYASSDIVRMIKSKMMRCTGHVALMIQKCVQSLVGKPKRKDHWVVLGMEGRMILKWI